MQEKYNNSLTETRIKTTLLIKQRLIELGVPEDIISDLPTDLNDIFRASISCAEAIPVITDSKSDHKAVYKALKEIELEIIYHLPFHRKELMTLLPRLMESLKTKKNIKKEHQKHSNR